MKRMHDRSKKNREDAGKERKKQSQLRSEELERENTGVVTEYENMEGERVFKITDILSIVKKNPNDVVEFMGVKKMGGNKRKSIWGGEEGGSEIVVTCLMCDQPLSDENPGLFCPKCLNPENGGFYSYSNSF